MEFLEKNRFKGITFLGNGKVHNGYINKEMLYDDYLKWAAENIYNEENTQSNPTAGMSLEEKKKYYLS